MLLLFKEPDLYATEKECVCERERADYGFISYLSG